MATVHKCAVCIWQSQQNRFTGRLIDDFEQGVAIGSNRKEVLDQLREYLVTRSKQDDLFWLEPDFTEAEVRVVRADVMPEYQVEGRRFPGKVPVQLRLPCVIGRRSTGLWAAFFPTLGLYFDFHDKERFQELAQHYARQNLSEMTPRQLARFLPPASCEVEYLTVTLKETPLRREQVEETPNLARIADPIGKRTMGKSSRAWEREDEVGELARLLGEDASSVILVGDSGCGKSSILVEAVLRQEQENKGEKNAPSRYWLTSASRIIAGMKYLGEWEERLENAIRELANVRGILCVDSLLELLRVGGSGPESSVASFLTPYLKNGELRIVAEATPLEVDACDRQLPGLIDEAQLLQIEALDKVQTLSVLGNMADYHARNDKIEFPRLASDEVYHLFRRFQPYVAFPGKAIQLMGAVVDHKFQEDAPSAVTLNDVRAEFGQVTGLPELFLREDIPLHHEDLEAEFSRNLMGQSGAVSRIARTIARFKAGMNDPGRPLGVLLFCGPTGVGKTQLVKLTGDYLFGGKPEKERLIRLDMSEYSGSGAAERLIGNVHGKTSELVQRVRANPFSVVLLDEVEKASDDVFDVLLSVFDEGRMTDPLGRVTSFNSTIIIMTSNLGAVTSGSMGFGSAADTSPVRTDPAAVRDFFRPEFFNRLDHVVYFQPLEAATVLEITRLELARISKREGFRDRQLELTFSEDLVRKLAGMGFDPLYGARPLQRALEERVVMPLARMLVNGEIGSDNVLELDWDPNLEELTVVEALKTG